MSRDRYYCTNKNELVSENVWALESILYPGEKSLSRFQYKHLGNINPAILEDLVWDETGPEPVVRFKTVEEKIGRLRQEALLKISYHFKGIRDKGVTVSNGFIMDCKPEDEVNLRLAIELSEDQGLTSTLVRDYENQTHRVSLDDLRYIRKEISSKVMQMFQDKWAAEESVKNSTTVEELNSIVEGLIDQY